MTIQLKCDTCNEMFEVSTEIADAMHRWRAQSSEPFTCGECAGVDEIYTPDNDLVGVSSARDSCPNAKAHRT